MQLASQIRPVPLKIAGFLGGFVSVFYLATVVGEETDLMIVVFWLVLMITPSLLAWFADQFEGRSAATVAAVLFFALGLLSPLVFALVYLAAVVLCVVGLAAPRG